MSPDTPNPPSFVILSAPEVLDADAFSLFEERGIFDPQTAKSFAENILSQGGTEDPMTLYKKFRGREPKNDALLKRAGLLAQD